MLKIKDTVGYPWRVKQIALSYLYYQIYTNVYDETYIQEQKFLLWKFWKKSYKCIKYIPFIYDYLRENGFLCR